MLLRVLLVVTSAGLHRRVRPILEDSGALVGHLSNPEDLWTRLGSEPCDLVVAARDCLLESPGAAIREIRNTPERPGVIVLTDREDPEADAALQAAGCFAIVSESLADSALRSALTTLVRRQRQTAVERVQAAQQIRKPAFDDFESKSPPMHELLRQARKVVRAGTSLLILGETGVGKEWLARVIHAEGPRAAAPFIAVNCAAVPETLLESELFGHEKGAFTGAVRARRGQFELAHRGTLFLDEIGDMPIHLQAKLLRALQERTIQRIGSEKALEIDVRVMASTNQDLEQAIEAKAFRRDLFYRLSVMTMVVPPLRERREDIPSLALSYFEQFRAQLGRTDVAAISDETLRVLQAHSWPGNVRELINVMERAVLLCESDLVTLEDLPQQIADGSPTMAAAGGTMPYASIDLETWFDRPLAAGRAKVIERFERDYLAHLLRVTRGSVSQTARCAGINARTVYNKMRLYGLRKEDFKAGRGEWAPGLDAAR